MAHERDDRWRGNHDDHYGRRDRDDYGSRGRGERGQRGEQGFFERAGQEISSWFGGDDQHRGSMRHDRGHEREGRFFSERDEDHRYRSQSSRDRSQDRDEDHSHRPMNWSASNRDYRESHDRDRVESARGGYKPITGDYGRGADEQRRSFSRGHDEDREQRSDWERDPYRRTSFAGSAAQSNHQDHPYDEMRRRHMEDFDRDYDEYRRENSQRFESDFGQWRERRQDKRQLLGRIREHMEVVGSDDQHVGTVDRIAGDKIILTKSDPDAGGHHHSLSCSRIDRVEDNRVFLDMEAEKARERWRDEDRERALFEREDQGEDGPHFLDRSFSGTYR